MRKWHAAVCCILMWLSPSENFRTQEMSLLPAKMATPKTQTQKTGPKTIQKEIPNSISEFFSQRKTESPVSTTLTVEPSSADDVQFLEDTISVDTLSMPYADDPEPPDRHYPVQHAGLPRKLEVFPLPLQDSDHELKFNVSWIPSLGGVARDYSLEVRSVTDTVDCQTPMCYEYNIPGEATWWLIPAFANPVAETCAVRPGCAYIVKLIAHPWDGHTSANLHVELDECVVGVCSCAHSPRLPAPVVSAQTVTIQGEMFANVSWTLPTPPFPQRLPSAKLGKQSYIVSLGKQMVSDAHPAPWFANIITRRVDADGFVSEGDTMRWLLLPVSERSVERSGERKGKRLRNVVPDVKLLARVNLVDDRGCVGPAGNATAFDPVVPATSKFSFGTYAILLALGGAWVMGAVFALSARVVKRVLKSFRPAPVSAPLEPLSRRPAWFPLQLRTRYLCYFQIMEVTSYDKIHQAVYDTERAKEMDAYNSLENPYYSSVVDLGEEVRD